MDTAVPQVPLTDDRGLIARRLEQLGHVLLAIVDLVVERLNSVDVVVRAGKDGGAAGGANGVRAKAVIQTHAALGDAIQMRRHIDPAAVAAHSMRRVIVAHDEENVRPGIWHCCISLV